MDVLVRLQKKLENFLEEDNSSIEEEKLVRQNYKLQTSDSFMAGLAESLPGDELDRVAVMFSRLVHVFEFGVLFSTENRALSRFSCGVIKNIKTESFLTADLDTLPFGVFVVPKSTHFTNQIRAYLPELRTEDEIFVIRLTDQGVLVVGTQLARPWLAQHLEKVQKSLSKALGS